MEFALLRSYFEEPAFVAVLEDLWIDIYRKKSLQTLQVIEEEANFHSLAFLVHDDDIEDFPDYELASQ